jgi:hypothetical protein
MSRPSEPTREASSALTSHAAALFRHAKGAEPKLLCMASYLGNGLFAAVSDELSDQRLPGPTLYADLRLHLLDGTGRVIWAEWAAELPILPLLLVKARGATDAPGPDIAPMADVSGRDCTTVWRIGYGRGVFHEVALEKGPRIAEGYVIHDPQMTWFRGGANRFAKARTLAVHCCFDYPGPADYGSPVVLSDGPLAGILVGGNLGPEGAHQGAYVPVELVLPFARLIDARATSDRSLSLACRQDLVWHHEDEDEAAVPSGAV